MFKKVFPAHGTFGALADATEWLKQRGYSWGSLSRNEPVAVKKGDWSIAKWRNLSDSDRFNIDGVLKSDDFREGSVELLLTNFIEDDEKILTEKAEDREMSLRMAEEASKAL